MTEPSGLQTTRPFRPVICTNDAEEREAVSRGERPAQCSKSIYKVNSQQLFQIASKERNPLCWPLFLSPSAIKIYS